MSRAVSGVFGTRIAVPTDYSAANSQEAGADGSSFGEALDRAQATQSKDTGKASGGSGANSKTAATKSAKTTTGRAKPVVKRAPAQDDVPQLKARKKDAQSPQDPPSDAAQNEAESEPEQVSTERDKAPLKKSSPADDSPDETPSAIVQIQGQSATQRVQALSNSSQKDESGLKRSANGLAARIQNSEPKDKPASSQGTDEVTSVGPQTADPNVSGTEVRAGSNENSAASAKSRLAIQPKNAANSTAEHSPVATVTAQVPPIVASSLSPDASPASPVPAAGPAVPAVRATKSGLDDSVAQALGQPPSAPTSSTGSAALDQAPQTEDTQSSTSSDFSETNHPKIVSAITGRLLPNGGAMQIRLDPPELGAMQLRVEMRDGVMTASFETSNDQATRLLSHSLGSLRTALEAQGVNVQKLQVTQSPKQHQPSTGDGQKDNSQTPQDTASQREQQRKEMVRRMWQKLMGGQDPVDLVA